MSTPRSSAPSRKRAHPPEKPPEKSRDPERTRARLLAAAEEEFGARGFHGARTRAIVDAAGVNERMLYHYFGDKEGLYRAVIEQGLSVMGAAAWDAMKGADFSDVGGLLERCLRALSDAFAERPSFVRLVVHEALNDFRSFPKFEVEPRDELLAKLWPLWEGAVAAGDVRSDVDPRVALAAGVLVLLVWPITIPRIQRLFPERDLGTKPSLEWARDHIIRVFARGITGEGAPARRPRNKGADKPR